jgi:hypothetical protein
MPDICKKLYVIFHGAWAFVDNAAETDCIHAYAADIGEHVFMAGSWLGETKILRGSTLLLKGAKGTPTDGKCDCLRNHETGIVLFPKEIACPVGAYAEIRLPRPTKIHTEIVVSGVNATITSGQYQDPVTQNLGLVPVFEYAFDPNVPAGAQLFSIPGIEGRDPFWTADPVDDDGVTTLHLWAADDTLRKDAPRDFEAVAKLLNFTIDLGKSVEASSVYSVQTPGLKGKRSFEITTYLQDRVSSLHEIGKQMQSQGLSGTFTWVTSSPESGGGMRRTEQVMGDLSSCGGGGGGS